MQVTADDIKLPEEFFSIAKKVYQGDPNWIPEQEEKIRSQFSGDNSYFSSNKAKVFVRNNDARLVGFYNPAVVIENEKVAYFGFWETINDSAITASLFADFEVWAKECGASRIYGPINFSTYQGNRLRIDAFDQAPFIDEPYNPSYYPDLVKEQGYEVKYHYLTGINQHLPNLVEQLAPSFKMMTKKLEGIFHFEPLNEKIWLENLENLYPLVDSIFSENFAYTPISWENFQAQCGEKFAKKMCPKTSMLVRDSDGEIAAFFITYPDYGSLVNQQGIEADLSLDSSNLDGSSSSALNSSDISFDQHYSLLKAPRLLLAKTAGIAHKYRAYGLFPLMIMRIASAARGSYEHMAGAMGREDNPSLSIYHKLVEEGNKDFVPRNYALFTKSLTADNSDQVNHKKPADDKASNGES